MTSETIAAIRTLADLAETDLRLSMGRFFLADGPVGALDDETESAMQRKAEQLTYAIFMQRTLERHAATVWSAALTRLALSLDVASEPSAAFA